MKAAAIYPFDAELLPIVRHFHEFQDKYELKSVIALPGAGLAGKDAAWACNQPEIHVTVEEKVDTESGAWETLLVAGDHIPEKFDIAETIKEAVEHKKEVIYFSHNRRIISGQLMELFGEEPLVTFSIQKDLSGEDMEATGFDSIKTPVILTGGLIEQADVLETTLEVTRILKKTGLSVAAITKEAMTGCFDLYDLSGWYSKHVELPERIFEINRVIREIERQEMPDVIVIEAPDAMIRFNNLVPNGFGIYTYLLCQAIRPDYIICCLPYDLAEEAYLKQLDNDFRVRFGAGIFAVHASNLLVDSMDLMQSKKMELFYDEFTNVINKINHQEKKQGIQIMNVIDNPKCLEDAFRVLMSEET